MVVFVPSGLDGPVGCGGWVVFTCLRDCLSLWCQPLPGKNFLRQFAVHGMNGLSLKGFLPCVGACSSGFVHISSMCDLNKRCRSSLTAVHTLCNHSGTHRTFYSVNHLHDGMQVSSCFMSQRIEVVSLEGNISQSSPVCAATFKCWCSHIKTQPSCTHPTYADLMESQDVYSVMSVQRGYTCLVWPGHC